MLISGFDFAKNGVHTPGRYGPWVLSNGIELGTFTVKADRLEDTQSLIHSITDMLPTDIQGSGLWHRKRI